MAQRVLPLPRQQSFCPPTVPNPFVHPGRLSAGDKLRTVLQGIILLPLRAIGMAFILLLAWLFASIATFRHHGKGSVPLKGWRRRMIQTTLSCLTRALFFVMGFQVKVKGKIASLLEAPIFVAAPHSSFFDAIICALTGMPSTVSRAENLSTPIFGTILSSLQPVSVCRQDPDSRKNTVTEITKRALSRGQWPQILIFPEGTCTNRSCLITFKQGAFVPRVPVQPVLLRYPNKLDTVTWTWQGYSLKELCVMTLCQLFTRVEVEFLPVHVPTEEEKNDPILFANRVRQTMATALNVPVTDHTFEDCRLMISAGQLTLPMEAGLVEFTKISKKLNLKWNHVREQLDTFAAIASASKGGRIGIEEFAEYLKLPISDVLKELFLLFDRLAGDDMEVCATELRDILNKVVSRHQDLKTDGFSLDTCRSMVAVMDSDTNGKLGFEEFKYLWNNIKKWQCVYKQYDTDQSGAVGRAQLPDALKAAGFHLNEQLCQVIVRRYANEDGGMDFNNFISCLVRLDSMFRAFKSLDRDGAGQIRMTIEDWLQLTMYS
ncbi:lysophosphatidylcholine acyltransferase 2 isoform X2 [Opisthocomus hoazin]|uniref:lysophosphatidylcholine acyltransferase 2 isoform X2 n=1 Tax=Opisthocomus hoazin TaxID=30419 RepID=UPI003F533A8A